MRVLIVAVGSRGDVARYTGLGAGLAAAGHDVTGRGPAPLPRRKLTADALAAAIRHAIDNNHYRAAATDLAWRVATEDSVTPVLKAVESTRPA